MKKIFRLFKRFLYFVSKKILRFFIFSVLIISLLSCYCFADSFSATSVGYNYEKWTDFVKDNLTSWTYTRSQLGGSSEVVTFNIRADDNGTYNLGVTTDEVYEFQGNFYGDFTNIPISKGDVLKFVGHLEITYYYTDEVPTLNSVRNNTRWYLYLNDSDGVLLEQIEFKANSNFFKNIGLSHDSTNKFVKFYSDFDIVYQFEYDCTIERLAFWGYPSDSNVLRVTPAKTQEGKYITFYIGDKDDLPTYTPVDKSDLNTQSDLEDEALNAFDSEKEGSNISNGLSSALSDTNLTTSLLAVTSMITSLINHIPYVNSIVSIALALGFFAFLFSIAPTIINRLRR